MYEWHVTLNEIIHTFDSIKRQYIIYRATVSISFKSAMFIEKTILVDLSMLELSY